MSGKTFSWIGTGTSATITNATITNATITNAAITNGTLTSATMTNATVKKKITGAEASFTKLKADDLDANVNEIKGIHFYAAGESRKDSENKFYFQPSNGGTAIYTGDFTAK
jgi:hypothetical protein